MQLAFAFSKICMKIENCLHANKESCSYTLVAVFESVDSIAKISFLLPTPLQHSGFNCNKDCIAPFHFGLLMWSLNGG